MFGYVTPCKMELKIKDYEKFKAYYCGVCKSIKKNFGNLPRLALNYDMTFLAVLLDSLEGSKCTFVKQRCIAHPITKRLVIINNKAVDYAAFSNVTLTYYKLLDNVKDDKSPLSKLCSIFLKQYIKKVPKELNCHSSQIESCLNELSDLEANLIDKAIDSISHPFADLTGFIISSYGEEKPYKDNLYWLGYNLGKWIYIIDAWDDLKKDMKKNKFNAINSVFNDKNLPYERFSKDLENRIDFILVTCASQCNKFLNELPLNKNVDILNNILQFGLMEKMDKVFNRTLVMESELS